MSKNSSLNAAETMKRHRLCLVCFARLLHYRTSVILCIKCSYETFYSYYNII